MQNRKPSPRTEYRLRENQRINDSISLAEKFPKLKSLSVGISYCDPAGLPRSGGMKYKPNLQHAKSVFYFTCPHGECVDGNFDLTEKLAEAVARRRKLVNGEMRCAGWHPTPNAEKVPCTNVLRFTLKLGY